MRQLISFGKALIHRARRARRHGVGHLASLGLAGVLVVLAILALGGAVSTYRVANSAKLLSELSGAFEQANFAVAAENLSIENTGCSQARRCSSGIMKPPHRYWQRLIACPRWTIPLTAS